MEDIDKRWRKSSYSGNGGGNCVEVTNRSDIQVRDSQDKDGARLAVPPQSWKAFTRRVQHDS